MPISAPYAEAWAELWDAGFAPFPLPAKKKEPPPAGVTGEFGVSPSYADCMDWAENPPRKLRNGNVAIRLNKGDAQKDRPGVVVLDVDHYEKGGTRKNGADTIARAEREWGPLPATWRSTARGADNPSGGRLYRVPPGTKIDASDLDDVDALHYGWRYLVVAPSINPLTGTKYQWIRPDSTVSDSPPNVDELPFLPEKWQAELVQPEQTTTHVASAEVEAFLASLPKGDPCSTVNKTVREITDEIRSGSKRHDTALEGVIKLLRLGEQRHPGAIIAIQQIETEFVNAVTADCSRTAAVAAAEFQRMVIAKDGRSKAVSLILAKPTAEKDRGCACLTEAQQRARAQKRAEQKAARQAEAERIRKAQEEQAAAAAKAAAEGADPEEFLDVLYQPELLGDPIKLTDTVTSIVPLVTDAAQHIWRYRDGVYIPDGERVARHIVKRLAHSDVTNELLNIVPTLVKTEPPHIDEDHLDTRYINTPSGLLDWRTGQLADHSPAIYSVQQIPVAWNPDATCPEIDKFFAAVLPADAIDLAFEIMGYCLLNDNPMHKAVMCYGKGRNGKGTYLRLITALVGEHNTSNITPQNLDTNRFARASLFGKLANLAGDVNAATFKETEMFKQLTGGDRVSAERKGENEFSFTNRATIIGGFNAFPRSLDTTEGFFSRWIVLPFPVSFRGREDTTLWDRLSTDAEMQGLLVKAVKGLQRLMNRGRFELPKSVTVATGDFRDAADPVRAFIQENVAVALVAVDSTTVRAMISRKELWFRWSSWADENGYQAGGRRWLVERFESSAAEVLGLPALTPGKRMGERGYYGLRLRAVDETGAVEDEDDEAG